jgi:glutathione S-transferase
VLTLYTTPLSANGRKVLAVSHELGLSPQIHRVNVYRGEGRTREYLDINPSGRIPTLVDGELALCESNAILLYLSEAHGDFRLGSREPAVRAHIAQWLFWESAHWQPAVSQLLAPFVGHRLRPDILPAPKGEPAWTDEPFHGELGLLEARLARTPWLVGDQASLADFSVAGMLSYFRAAGFPWSAHPALAGWYSRIEARESWRATRTPPWD